MKVICISGKAESGKDYTAERLKDVLVSKGKKVRVVHYADSLKFICREFLDWDGKKDSVGRSKLQQTGTQLRGINPDFFVEFLISVLRAFQSEWDYVIIPDTRFRNEVMCVKNSEFSTLAIRVERPEHNNRLTSEQRAHASEVALDDFEFDVTLTNTGGEDYCECIRALYEQHNFFREC